jgi:geranylgeranyl pyrophosphate synthase
MRAHQRHGERPLWVGKGVTEIAALYGPVAEDLPYVRERLHSLANGHHPLLGDTLAYVFDSGGKQLRPALVMLCGMLGKYERDRLVTLAASLEVVHTATLVHDDTIDQALTRRGLKTVSALWSDKIAILTGDFLFAQSALLASQLGSVRIMSLLSETVMAMVSGEMRQHSASQLRTVDEGAYLQRITDKTASLFGMCCEGAAVVSDQPDDHISALRNFGISLGIAFQIADDVLDFSGDEDSLGKPAGADLRDGTMTLPVILLMAGLPAESQLRLDIQEGRNLVSAIEEVRQSGALEASLARAREYARTARSFLDIFADCEAKRALVDLTDAVLTRGR